MSAQLAPPAPAHTGHDDAWRLVSVGVALSVTAALLEAAVLVFGSTTPGTGPYQHAGDYWLTAAALPHAAGVLLVLLGVRRRQGARDGRLGLAGLVLAAVCLVALSAIITASLVVAHEIQGGPTYVLGTLGAVIGIGLFAAGSWRVGVLPRWLLAIWPVIWGIGSFAAVSISPLALVAFDVTLLVIVGRDRSAPGR
jgi:hypothetical protein